MPRAIGQIDTRKSEAILEAAAQVLAARGLGASIEEVARLANVSKQTIYNHFGSKTDLVRILMERRRSVVTAALDDAPPGQSVEDTLASYAQSILEVVASPQSIQLTRMGVAGATEMPDLSRTLYDAGSHAALLRLADYLAQVPRNELDIPDTRAAAEMFSGMVIGRLQTRLLFGLDPELDTASIPARAREAAMRFVRAFRAPESRLGPGYPPERR